MSVALVIVILAGLPSAASAAISSTPDQTVVVNGTVGALVHSSTRTYIGGNFVYAGAPTIGSGGVDASTGALQPGIARVTAGTNVTAVIGDGAGGFYVGGTFTALAGQAVTNLARIKPDGTLDTAFLPNPDAAVTALAVTGGSVYAGGSFTTIGAQTATPRLAKLNATTGAVDTTFTPAPNATVSALVGSGTTLYAGGAFTTIGAQTATPGLAKLDTTATTTAASVDTAFTAAPSGSVVALTLAGNALYAGGTFPSIGAQSATPNLARLNATTGDVDTTFKPAPTGVVNALAVSSDGSVLYAAGGYTSIGAQGATPRLTKLDPAATTAAASVDTTWAPSMSSAPTSLVLTGNALYVGGSFGSIGTLGQVATPNLAKLNATTAAVDLAFAPVPTTAVFAFALSGTTIYAGGAFPIINGVRSNGLAAMKLDGTVDRGFAPAAANGSTISAMALAGTSLYVGGVFSAIGGQSISDLTRLDAATGAGDTTWNPAPNNIVSALALAGGTTLFAGGGFSNIGGQTATPRLAKLVTTATTTATTVDTTWNAAPSGAVNALAVDGTALYAGGSFSIIGTITTTPRLAKLITTATGTTATVDASFAPAPSTTVNTLAISAGGPLYAGGSFSTIGAQSGTPRLAKLNATTGVVDTAFAPQPSNTVTALNLAPVGATRSLYAGGLFSLIGGQGATPRLAKLGPTTGAVDTTFAPVPSSTVSALAAHGGRLYAGGAFSSFPGGARVGFAQFTDPAVPTSVRWRGGSARVVRGHGVRLRWRTGAEADNLGFAVLRARRGHKHRVRISRRMIAGGALQGGRSSSRYRFNDRRGRRGDRYYIRSYDLRGAKRLHGPLVARRAAVHDRSARVIRGHGVRVQWRTGLKSLGFDVLRVRRGHTARVKIGALQRRRSSTRYRVTDHSGRRGDRYYLRSHGLHGRTRLYGPLIARRRAAR